MKTTLTSSLARLEPIAVLLLRIGVGVILLVHGWMKLTDVAGTAQGFASLGIPEPTTSVYASIAAEFLGGLGLTVGLLTRVAAFGIFCNMLVAIATAHLGHGLLAKNGGFEYPLVLALAALFFIAHGAGRYSLDAVLSRSRAPGFRSQRVPSHA